MARIFAYIVHKGGVADDSAAELLAAAKKIDAGQSPTAVVTGCGPDLDAVCESLRASFFDALAEDFNTARALSVVFEWVAQANRSTHAVGSRDLEEMLSVLGLANLLAAEAIEVPAEVRERAEARERARAAGDYAEADRIRDQLRADGWELRDGPDGPELLPGS